MTLRELIAEKRDGLRHSAAGLDVLAATAVEPATPDYQLSAWLMAAYINGLDLEETAWLTQAMARSGERLDLEGLPKPWVDKHSTGGVGDKTTIALLPVLAAGGLTVVKMSGRGLGITGGTIDKLSAIPGFRTDLTPTELVAQAHEIRIALTGQTANLAPADKRLYGLRDVTETVASIPLIVSSILSKKIAGGAEVLGLDVKCGSGAFMKDLPRARELGRWLVDVGNRCGLATHVTITDMDQPLGRAAGNAIEVREALESLHPNSPQTRFVELVVTLAAEAFVAAGISPTLEAGAIRANQAIQSGAALETATKWIEAQGGNPAVAERPDLLAVADRAATIVSDAAGWIQRIDAECVGRAVLDLGGGRNRADDIIDTSVGVETLKCVGERIAVGEPLFHVLGRDERRIEAAMKRLSGAAMLSQEQTTATPLILDRFA